MRNHAGCRIALMGDVFLKSLAGGDPFREIRPIVSGVDLAVVNLETCVTTRTQSVEKAVTLRAGIESLDWLKSLGKHVVANVANNHTFDFGLDGFKDTLRYLDEAGIGVCGALTGSPKQSPYTQPLSCGKVAVLGYSEAGTVSRGTGIARLDRNDIIEDIKSARRNGAAWILVNLHWGIEYSVCPSPGQQRLARSLVDAGADVIAGTHPHVTQGIETYEHGLICYSLGNFNFHTSLDDEYPYSDTGCLALLSPEGNRIRHYPVPIVVDSNFHPVPALGRDAERIKTRWERLSSLLLPEVKWLAWLSEASAVVFKSNLNGFALRIRQYGARHFFSMVKWLLHPSVYKYYLGILLRPVYRIKGRGDGEP